MDSYEQKYKDALERARKLYERGTITESLGHVFPELKESDDERIRKALIEMVHDTIGDELWVDYNIHKDETLDWLEKQGESYTKKDVDDAYLEGMVCAKNELEKQGEQKEYTFKSIPRLLDMIEPTERAKAYTKKLINTLTEEGYITDAKIVEECLKQMNGEDVAMAVMDGQPITDKVEPKFKVGDWIVDNQGLAHQIERVVENITTHTFGYDIVGGGYFNDKSEGVRLWNISDAKDGDVLYSPRCGESWIFEDEKKCHVGYNPNYNSGRIVIDKPIRIPTDAQPATEEQRELLFKKMKEAGYEWDEEKKELKIKLKEPDVYEYELERIIDKLNEIIGKLGDIHEVLSKPFLFPYRDYIPPQEPWYDIQQKTHGVERVPPVTCETTNEVKAEDGKDV